MNRGVLVEDCLNTFRVNRKATLATFQSLKFSFQYLLHSKFIILIEKKKPLIDRIILRKSQHILRLLFSFC